jgi:hypothetical protein
MQVTHVVGATNLLVAVSAFLGVVSNRWPRLTGVASHYRCKFDRG